MRPLSHNAEASEQFHRTCEVAPLRQLVVMAAVRLTVFSYVCDLGEGRQQKSANREQANMVRVMDSLPYLSIHTSIHTLWSTF